jgi:hypothetical protein
MHWPRMLHRLAQGVRMNVWSDRALPMSNCVFFLLLKDTASAPSEMGAAFF